MKSWSARPAAASSSTGTCPHQVLALRAGPSKGLVLMKRGYLHKSTNGRKKTCSLVLSVL